MFTNGAGRRDVVGAFGETGENAMKHCRREFIKSIAATAIVPGLAKGTMTAEESTLTIEKNRMKPESTRRPKNVVLMICDDLGYGDLGCYGSKLKTPHLDKFAAEGTRFTHFNAAHPLCSASRAALLTGRYAQRSHTIGAFHPNTKIGMSLQEVTLANLFQNRGYRTHAIGKWHLGDALEYLPTKRGFDSFYGVPYSDDMQPLPMIRDTTILETDTDRDLLTPRYTEDALRFLEENAQKPFFLYFAYSYPHDPARASARFQGASGLGDFGDSVQEIDWSVGEIVHSLERNGILEDTLLLFTSDHGPWYQGNPGNLRGRKGSTFEGGFRVPFLAHWPAGLQAGTAQNAWATNLDILPTLAALCGLDASPNPLDGIDISAILLDGQEDIPRKSLLYFTPLSSANTDIHCARRGDWKLRLAQIDGEMYINDYTTGHQSFWLPRPELYNLALDPAESYDVAKEHPEIVKAISEDVEAQIATMPEEVKQAYSLARKHVARSTTPPGGAPRPPSNEPLPPWAWEPIDRR